MMTIVPLLLLLVGCAMPLFASEPASVVPDYMVPARTSVPFTYCIGYIVNPEEESFLKELAKSPPDLYHLGYQIPFKGALGPTYGHELFTDSILPPSDIPREIDRIHRLIAKMRAAGTGRLIPYVYTMAFFGHPEKRTGFFRFYDQWDDYRIFGLGPKPAADPSLWSQVPGPRPLGGGPEDVLHYDPCVNHPGWSDYLDLVTRQLASVGYDGMFFDVNTQYCYCPHCQEKFDIYLLRKYGRPGLQEAYGTSDHREINLSVIYRDFEKYILENFQPYLQDRARHAVIKTRLNGQDPAGIPLEEDWRLLRCYMQGSLGEFPPEGELHQVLMDRFQTDQLGEWPASRQNQFTQTVLRYYFREYLRSRELAEKLRERFGSSDIPRRCLGQPRDLWLWMETQRFWCRSMAGTLARLKQVGQSELLKSNRAGTFYTVANLGSMQTVDGLNKRRVDGIDLTHFAPMADMQMFEEMPQPGSLESGVIISNIFAFRWAAGAGTKAGTLLYKTVDETAADLSHAEAAAGGGGAFIQAGLNAPDSRARWKRFFAEYSHLWENGASYARVGLLFWSGQVFYEYPEHVAMTRRIIHILSENQVPFDIITEEGLATVSHYEVIFAPQLRYLADSHIHALLAYVEQGGRLVVIEPFGTEDPYARKRGWHPLSHYLKNGNNRPLISHGQGHILDLRPEEVPLRHSDAWVLMEERAGAFLLSSDFLNVAREQDVKHHVDLGTGFVSRLEKSFQIRLRWSPPNTDAGVYIHPYRISPSENNPEKLVLHAVNYRVPIRLDKVVQETDDPIWDVSTRSSEPIPQKFVRISVPLPPDRQVHSVKSCSPVDEIQPVAWEVKDQTVMFAIPELKIYQAIVIQMDTR